MIKFAAGLLTVVSAASFTLAAQAQNIDWNRVDAAFGKPAAVTGDVHRYALPRTDLQVKVDGVQINPALALGGWDAFKPMADQAMVMGDVVLLENEIKPVMTKLIEGGLYVTAVHNHLLRADPATFYLHVSGSGDPAKLASAIRAGLDESKTPFQRPSPSAAPSTPLALDTGALDRILGTKGHANGAVYQFTAPHTDTITQDGVRLTPAGPLGVATGINFQPLGEGRVAITGDFVLTAEEVNPVIHALRDNDIEVTAVHSHMLNEQPRLFFLHFWAADDAIKVANGLHAAMARTRSATSEQPR
jgi:hypothetical protein